MIAMPSPVPRLAALILVSLALSGCDRLSGDRHVADRHDAGRDAREAARPPAPPPARPMKMVCRNSQDGRKVPCGSPNAVMVGMEPG
jgi:hypothetical protein